jgi:hypothetical protein
LNDGHTAAFLGTAAAADVPSATAGIIARQRNATIARSVRFIVDSPVVHRPRAGEREHRGLSARVNDPSAVNAPTSFSLPTSCL